MNTVPQNNTCSCVDPLTGQTVYYLFENNIWYFWFIGKWFPCADQVKTAENFSDVV